MRDYYFNRDVKFSEIKENGLTLIDNRNRAQDFGELPFVIRDGDSFVMIEKYRPVDEPTTDNYTFDRVEGKGFGADVLNKMSNVLNLRIYAD